MELSYFASGLVKTIRDSSNRAEFRYDPFGAVQELELASNVVGEGRHDRHYGGLIEQRDVIKAGSVSSIIDRHFLLPNGWSATRPGPKKTWVFAYNDGRGARTTVDGTGTFTQDVDYQPFGEAKSNGAQPGELTYTANQWNGGDALSSLGLSQLGVRLYDPVIGRFLSRDPMRMLRTAATSNAYAFALNDPWNRNDPTGKDPDFGGCIGKECEGPSSDSSFPGGGPSSINPFSLYFPSGEPVRSSFAAPAPYVAPPTTTFANAPTGPVTAAGKALKEATEDQGIEMGSNFNFDTLAATGLSKESMMTNIAETPEAHAAVDSYNARLESVSSFSAGFGDAVWFWCPGCGANFRQSWNINSGSGDSWAYGVGSFTGIVGQVAAPHPTSVASPAPEQQTLYHYTTEGGHTGIVESEQIFASEGPVHARHGAGSYFTDIAPEMVGGRSIATTPAGQMSLGQLSARLFRVPWNTGRLGYYLEVNVSGLNAIEVAPNIYLVPGTEALDVSGRIIRSGATLP